jgi:hypothetical protein
VHRWRTMLAAAVAATGLAAVAVSSAPSAPTDSSEGMVVAAATAATAKANQPFGITVRGKMVKGLYPGAVKEMRLTLTNPYNFDLSVTELHGVVYASSKKTCKPGPATVMTQPYRGALPLVLPKHGKKAFGYLPVAMADNASMSCQKTYFKIRLVGTATKAG